MGPRRYLHKLTRLLPLSSPFGSTCGCSCDDSAFFPNGSPYGLPCASFSRPFPKVSILASAPTLDSV
ncbi:hypothetical protein EBU02_14085 [bacterium]|nr:hypothetical protein [bacterium]